MRKNIIDNNPNSEKSKGDIKESITTEEASALGDVKSIMRKKPRNSSRLVPKKGKNALPNLNALPSSSD
jgi:hypothetical protein